MNLSVPVDAEHQNDFPNANDFLRRGAFVAKSNLEWVVFWGKVRICPEPPKRGLFISDFFLESPIWLEFEESKIFHPQELMARFADEVQSTFQARTWDPPDPSEFSKYFQNFRTDLSLNKLQKLVPVIFAHSKGSLSLAEKWTSLQKLSSCQEGVYPYGYWLDGLGLLGATPEFLFKGESGQFETMALAGTSAVDGPCLLDNDKEVGEHQFVKLGIEEKLESHALRWQPTCEWSVGPLKHLRTLAQFEWSESFEELVRLLHPTPALGVYPQNKDPDLLRSYCASERRLHFGSPFGFISPTSWQCLVAIRNIQWFDNRTYLGSGCGLVRESQEQSEWNELALKRNFTLQMLGL